MGITTDGTNIWIIDYVDKEVYKYEGPSVLGWTGKINGISNITSINGISIANIKTVNGI